MLHRSRMNFLPTHLSIWRHPAEPRLSRLSVTWPWGGIDPVDDRFTMVLLNVGLSSATRWEALRLAVLASLTGQPTRTSCSRGRHTYRRRVPAAALSPTCAATRETPYLTRWLVAVCRLSARRRARTEGVAFLASA